MNLIGVAAALAAFFCIWLGHVLVRKVEYLSPSLWLPAVFFVLLGLAAEIGALLSGAHLVAAVLGISGITLLWDALELIRQQRRVYKGHAPANPMNPRHIRILAESGSHATTTNLLEREPAGLPISED